MFEGDSADMCARKFPLVSMGGRAEGLACADPGARTPIGTSGIPNLFRHSEIFETLQFYSWFKEDIPKIKVDIPSFMNVS